MDQPNYNMTSRGLRSELISIMICIVCGMCASPTMGQLIYQRIATTDQAAPGITSPRTVDELESSASNESWSAFSATVTILGEPPRQVLFRRQGQTFEPIATEDEPVLGSDDGSLFDDNFGALYLNQNGQIAFLNEPQNNGVFGDTTLYVFDASEIEKKAAVGEMLPNSPFEFLRLAPLRMSESGHVYFFGDLTLPGSTDSISGAIFSDRDGDTDPIVSVFDPVPGMAGFTFGDEFSAFDVDPFRDLVENNDHIAFLAYLNGPGINFLESEMVIVERSGQLMLIARATEPVPGDPEIEYSGGSNFRNLSIDTLGQVAFISEIVGQGIDGTNNEIICGERDGTLQILVRAGDPLPQANDNAIFGQQIENFGQIFDDLHLTNDGRLAFQSHLDNAVPSRRHAIIVEESDGLRTVVRAGDDAPGTNHDFENSSVDSPFLQMAVNDSLQVAVYAMVGPTASTEDTGIWATNDQGEIILVAREGDLFDVNDDPNIDDLRTIDELSFVLDENLAGQSQVLTNDGNLFFSLRFTDLSYGSFVANINGKAIQYQTITAEGLGAGGTEVNFAQLSVHPPIISHDGRVSFLSFIARSLYSQNDTGDVELVLNEGDPATGAGPNATLTGFPWLNVNNAREFCFVGGVEDSNFPNFGDHAVWFTSQGLTQPIAIDGANPPGVPTDLAFLGFSEQPIMNESGQIAFMTQYSENSLPDLRGLWSQGNGELELVAAEGDPVPNTPDGFAYESLLTTPSLNNLGDLVARVRMAGAGLDVTNNGVVIAHRNGITGVIAKNEDPADFVAPGVSFRNVIGASGNDNRQIAFRATFAGPGIDDFNDSGVVVEHFGQYMLIAQKGELAPIPDTNLIFATFSRVLINAPGHVSFSATLAGEGVNSNNDSAIFLSVEGKLVLLAREGDPIPGSKTEAILGSVSSYALNNMGQVAFQTNLTNPNSGVTGVFATDTEYNLLPVAVIGESFDVSPNAGRRDLRTIDSCDLVLNAGGQDGRPTCISDAGEVVFFLGFEDGSEGIFTVATESDCILGDVNGDGHVDLLDIAPFVQAIGAGKYIKSADINLDGVVDLLDIEPFVMLLGSS